MRTLLRLILVVAGIVVVLWFIERRGGLQEASRDVRAEVGSAAREAKDALSDLDASAIGEELKRTGQVVRRKVGKAARQIAESSEDARTTAAIKTKLAIDPELSALDISVDTTEGRVTLAGKVDSPELVARAVRLALEEDDVHEVVSTLQVRKAGAEQPKKVTLVR